MNNVSIRIETITPEIAQKYIDSSATNRSITPRHVEWLASMMRKGQFKFNGDSIRFNGEQMIDGQHRCMAVIASGITIQTVVVRNLDANIFDTIDTGRKRKGNDILSIKGYQNCINLCASLNIIHLINSGALNKRSSLRLSNQDIEQLVLLHSGVVELVEKYSNKRSKQHVASPSLMAAMHYLFRQKDLPSADKFMQALVTGENLTEGDPALLLRERLMGDKKNTHSIMNRSFKIALFIKAWNHYRSGRKLTLLKFRIGGDKPEPIPDII
jgi:hypothetical protein